ncbi:CaiB/BaiF CoA-transferase family protein [Sphingomonas sp. IC4-52]|uniref:CaiB/BaiF CoA-transferase family protein n=1 Tax=Sphingomonas sp. IC4-52 TaxID=2887202 RepID=UPI001D122A7F|nr:CoA transferase [Sphingomonas sp. IC4-52]MCC2980610.1 CoA transferase [Sphingomonas sp. IC4-52]
MAVDRPLRGVRVVDAVHGPLSVTTRYLAELGAQVDRIVVAAAGDSLSNRIANLGKTMHPFDHHAPQAAALLAAADIIVEDCGLQPSWRLPAQVIVSVSPFGHGNSFSGWQASDAILNALSGELSRSGIRGREPLLPPGQLAWQCAAVQAAFLALQSYFLALRTGQGDRIDFAALDGAVQALDPGFGIGGSATLGRPAHLLSRDRPAKGFQYPIIPCADGHVRLCLLAARQWQGMFRWMGEPPAFSDPSFNKTAVRYKSPDLLPAIAAFFADKTRAELEAGAISHGVPLSGLSTLAEAPMLPHFVERASFRSEAVDGATYPVPNGCIIVDGERMTPEADHAQARLTTSAHHLSRPFEGLKVLDLGVIVVGAETGRLLADQGADVVKVESAAFPDGNRQSYLPYGLSASFAAGHRNKRSVGLDLRDPDGKALFLRLVGQADVVLSNFKPGTMQSLGLGRDVLKAANPRVISVESSAFGDSGPWSKRMGYGPLVRAATGLTEAWRYADDPESFSDSITIYPDHVAGRVGAIAAVALLIRRERTGQGGHASIAQAEVMLAQFGAEIARASTGAPAQGERSAVYRCSGDDEWIALTMRTDADSAAVASVCEGQPLEEWLACMDADDAMRRLQAAGVPVARMLRVGDLPAFDYVSERHLLRCEHHPFLADPVTAEARQAHSRLPAAPMRSAPLMGEHSDEILGQWLALDPDTIERLAVKGVIQRTSPDERRAIEQTLAASASDRVGA